MFKYIVHFLVFGLTLVAAVSAPAQHGKILGTEVAEQPTSCEINRILLDRAFVEFQRLNDDSSLIIITRPGLSERQRKLTLARGRDIEKFIHFRRVTNRYVLAEGPAISNLGSSEIYVGGTLIGTIVFARNSKLVCEPET